HHSLSPDPTDFIFCLMTYSNTISNCRAKLSDITAKDCNLSNTNDLGVVIFYAIRFTTVSFGVLNETVRQKFLNFCDALLLRQM
ncbi:MAG: hypothetical protein KAQ89_03420, partial [Planctomycetes bacterium]|nr:hypothetical protein [Planctomycetota bacterium]